VVEDEEVAERREEEVEEVCGDAGERGKCQHLNRRCRAQGRDVEARRR
jgi:hypothetical protein